MSLIFQLVKISDTLMNGSMKLTVQMDWVWNGNKCASSLLNDPVRPSVRGRQLDEI